MNKLVTGLLLSVSMVGTAIADPIYIDVGADYDPGGSADTAAGGTTTGWKDSLKLTYNSESVVTDNGDGVFSVGDTIVSSGGLIPGAVVNENLVTEMVASEVFGIGPSDNGYGTDWAMSFRFDNLMGSFDGFDFSFISGSIDFLLYDTTHGTGNEVHLFTLTIEDHVSSPGNQLYRGSVGNFGAGTVNGVDIGDIFNISFGGSAISFEDYNDTQPMDVFFRIDQNTDGISNDLVTSINNQFGGVAGATADVSASHDGSLEFSVPEPTSLAILGLGLIGLAGASRRRA